MTDSVHADDFDPPLTPRQVEQVQELINEALRRQLVPAKEKKLSQYQPGDAVEVFQRATWVSGNVSSVARAQGLVYVDTELGPVTIASIHNIKPG